VIFFRASLEPKLNPPINGRSLAAWPRAVKGHATAEPARSGQTPLDEMRWLLIQIDPSGINFVFLNFLNSLTYPLT
jgi:hypothetical protein